AAALVLKAVEGGEIFVQGAVQALLIKAEAEEALGLFGKSIGVGYGGLDAGVGRGGGLGVFRGQGEEVHFDGAEVVEAPSVGSDGVREGVFEDGLRLEVGQEFCVELFEVGAIFGGEDDDLAREAVAAGVEAGGRFSLFRFGAGGFLGVAAVGGDLFLCGHVVSGSRG